MNVKILFSENTAAAVDDLKSSISSKDEDINSWMPSKLMGQNLFARNLSILDKICDVKSIEIPKCYQSINKIIHHLYPSIDVAITDEMKDIPKKTTDDKSSSQSPSLVLDLLENSIDHHHKSEEAELRIQFNSILHLEECNRLVIEVIQYPWNFLQAVQKILRREITNTVISRNAKVSKTCIIDGPCIIESGAVIDDFCKIVGPAYIGANTFVGMGSLVRNSILEQNTRIGFNCEIGKSYLAGNDRISHHNVILDTIVGQNVWFGGYSGTANVLLDRRNVRYQVNGILVDTETDHFGSVIEDNCCIGASVIILPGRRVHSNTQIQAGTIFRSQKEAFDSHQIGRNLT